MPLVMSHLCRYIIMLSVVASSTRAATGLDGCLYWIDHISATWSPAQWKKQVAYMQKAGLNHIILCGAISATTQPTADEAYAPLDRLMDACKGTDLRIYISLQSHPVWYGRWNLEEEVSANRVFVSSTASRYDKHPNFAGWYIPHEIYVMWDRQGQYMRDLYTALSKLCKQRTPDKKVILSPFFVLDRSKHFGDFRFAEPDEYEAFWYDVLHCAQIDIIALQDSGEHLSFYTMADRRPFFAAMKRACKRAGKTLWINIETGELQVDGYADYEKKFGLKVYVNDPRTAKSWHVVAPEKLRTKLKLASEFADTTITWGYYPYWDPMLGPTQQAAYDAYLACPASRPN